ncbi:MAG: hypothetical protein IPK20_00560 [Betaproteobacteria bacterium]|nr:hypothetical protein [Betaproteobacteria bacterium]
MSRPTADHIGRGTIARFTGGGGTAARQLVMKSPRPPTASVSAVIVSMPAPMTRIWFPSTLAMAGLDEEKSK